MILLYFVILLFVLFLAVIFYFFNLAFVRKNNTDIELDFTYNQEKKREFKINKVKSTSKDFKLVVKTVLFSTKDLLLLRGAPQDRSDWLDRAISQIYPAYDERLSKYEKIRVQKEQDKEYEREQSLQKMNKMGSEITNQEDLTQGVV